jgi:hypothetical protein
MVNIVPVDRDRHAGKGWRRPANYNFAAKDPVVALVASEFLQAALALPIGFVEQSGFFVPVMLTSPVPNRNVAVGPAGQWFVGYVPAVLRAYPFSLRSGEKETLCIDEDSGLVVEADNTTEKFFQADGSFSPIVVSILELLRQIGQSRRVTNRAVVSLSDAGLIKRWSLVVPVGEQQMPVNGLYCCDEAALDALDDVGLIEVRRALPMAYVQIFSMGQVGVLSRLASIQHQMAQFGQQLEQGSNRPPPAV